MSDSNSATASASVAFPVFTLITGVLLVLKLGNVGSFGDLSWWWVFAPMLAGLGIAIFFILIFLIILVIVAFLDR
jgi:hypothetical protein